jgi:hypothetical protein
VLNWLSTKSRWRMGSGCIDPRFLDLGTSWSWVVSFTPRQFHLWGRSPWYPLGRMGGPQRCFGRYGVGKSLASTENWTQAVQSVARRYTDWAIPGLTLQLRTIVLFSFFIPFPFLLTWFLLLASFSCLAFISLFLSFLYPTKYEFIYLFIFIFISGI